MDIGALEETQSFYETKNNPDSVFPELFQN